MTGRFPALLLSAFLAASAAAQSTSATQDSIGGLQVSGLVEGVRGDIARALSIPERDIASLFEGRAPVLPELSPTESTAYDWFKGVYDGSFEEDFTSRFDQSFDTAYSQAWSVINAEQKGLDMGSGFTPATISMSTAGAARPGMIVRLLVDPASGFDPAGRSAGSTTVFAFDDAGALWRAEVAGGFRARWEKTASRIADGDGSTRPDPASAALTANTLLAVETGGEWILTSTDRGETWQRVARNDARFDEERKNAIRARGLDDAARRALIRQFYEAYNKEAAEEGREPRPLTDDLLEELVWAEARFISTIVSFRAGPLGPGRLNAQYSSGSIGTFALDELIAAGDVARLSADFFAAPDAEAFDPGLTPHQDFAVREAEGAGPDGTQRKARRALVVLAERFADTGKTTFLSGAHLDTLRRHWRPSTIALFSAEEGTGVTSERPGDPISPFRFVAGTFAGDGQIAFGLDDQGKLHYALDPDSGLFDRRNYELARARSEMLVERARVAFNEGVAAAEAKEDIPELEIPFAAVDAYNQIAKVRWSPLDKRVAAIAGARAGIWTALDNGDLRFHRPPALTAMTARGPRPAQNDLLDLERLLSRAIEERALVVAQAEAALALLAETGEFIDQDLDKFRLTLRLEAGGLASETLGKTPAGGGVSPDSVVGGAAALASEVPFAATLLNVSNFILGEVAARSSSGSGVDNPAFRGFDTLRGLDDMKTSMREAFRLRADAVRVARRLCVASPAAREACLRDEGLLLHPGGEAALRLDGELLGRTALPETLPNAAGERRPVDWGDDKAVEKAVRNLLESRFLTAARATRQQARCTAWTALLPRIAFLYSYPLETTAERNAALKTLLSRYARPFGGEDIPLAVVAAPKQDGRVILDTTWDTYLPSLVMTPWSIRVGTKEVNMPPASTTLDQDGYELSLEKGARVHGKSWGTLDASDFMRVCDAQTVKAVALSLEKWAEPLVEIRYTRHDPRWRPIDGYQMESLARLIAVDDLTATVAIPFRGRINSYQMKHYYGGALIWAVD